MRPNVPEVKRKRLRWLTGLFFVLFGIALAFLVWLNRPLSQPLVLRTATPDVKDKIFLPIATRTVVGKPMVPVTAVTVSADTQAANPTEVAKVCGNTGIMHLLVVGQTSPDQEEDLGADAIRLVTLDFNQPSAAVVTLPAILWVDSPALADQGIKSSDLTSVYLKAYLAFKGDTAKVRAQKATQVLAQTILDNFGFLPDHYITVTENVFIEYVNALGGVEIYLSSAVDGSKEGYGIYPAGSQILDGKHALNFSRLFHPGGVKAWDIWGNLGRQDLVVKGLLEASLRPPNWLKIPGLIGEVSQAVVTDLSPSQMLDLACMANEVGEKTRLLTVDEKMTKRDSLGKMIPDVVAIKGLIAEMDPSD